MLCAGHKGTYYSAAIGRAAIPYQQQMVTGSQYGATKGGCMEFPMFIARLLLAHAAGLRKSAALSFGDLRKTYHSVLLRLVAGPLFTQGEREFFWPT